MAGDVNVRVLSPQEYGMLPYAAEVVRQLSSCNSIVAGAFDGDQLVGSMILLNVPHFEGPWIEPSYRNGTLFVRMEQVLIAAVKRLGARKVLGLAAYEVMEDYLQRGGYRKMGTLWEKEI